MKHNALFNFIKSFPSPHSHYNLVHASNREGRDYFRFDFLPDSSAAIEFKYEADSLSLESHHISVYAQEHNYNPHLSQYHYTAYFRNQDRLRYQMHIYFNHQDDMVGEIDFIQWNESGGSTKLYLEDQAKDFTAKASMLTKDVIGFYRKSLDAKIQDLNLKRYTLKMELEELIPDEATQYAAFIAKLADICEVITEIIPLIKYNHHAQKELLFFQNLILAYQQKKSAPASYESDQDDVDSSGLRINWPKLVKSEIARINLDDSVAALSQTFRALSQDDEASYAQTLIQLLSRSHELSLLISEPQYKASPMGLHQLQQLYLELNQKLKTLVPRLLLTEHFKILTDLPGIHQLITPNHFILALQMRRPELLNFILSHSDINLDYFPLVIRGVSYPSVLDYCLEKDSHTTPMAECFGVLIKHYPATIFQDKDGLPIAHSILSTKNHPFRKTLLREIRTSDSNKMFLQQLIKKLSAYRDHGARSVIEVEMITAAIQLYHLELKALNFVTKGSAIDKFSTEFCDKYYAKFYSEELKRDSDFIALNTELSYQIRLYQSKLTHIDKLAFDTQCLDGAKVMDEFLSQQESISIDYPEVRKKSLEILEKIIDFYIKKSRLYDIEQILKRKIYIISKADKKLAKEAMQIKLDLNQIIQSLSIKTELDFTFEVMVQTAKDYSETMKKIMMKLEKSTITPSSSSSSIPEDHKQSRSNNSSDLSEHSEEDHLSYHACRK